MTATKRRAGRPTKAEELRRFAEHAGVEPETLEQYLGAALPPPPSEKLGPAPEKWADWESEIKKILWERIHTLDGVAGVNAWKLVKALADEERIEEAAAGPSEDDRKPLLDRLDALPKPHAKKLVKAELSRLDGLRAEYFAALERLEAE